MSRLRLRISLLSALLLITIAGLLLVIWRLYGELVPLRLEVLRWRNEAGILTLTDKSKMHSVYRKTHDEKTWRWRVYMPEKHDYWLSVVVNGIPNGGYPETTSHGLRLASGMASNEYDISVAIRKGVDDQYQLVVEHTNEIGGHNKTRLKLRRNDGTWPDGRDGSSETRGDEPETRTERADGRLLLLRHRVFGQTRPIRRAGPVDGILIWIERRDGERGQ